MVKRDPAKYIAKASSTPRVSVFVINREPEALKREEATTNQIRKDTNTIIWGDDDALPLRILKAVDESPTTTSCLDTVETFIRGAAFEDQELMQLVVNKEGLTLWELHGKFCAYMAHLEGFACNFKYDSDSKITSVYPYDLESLRFLAPPPKSKEITTIRYNPYFGTDQWRLVEIKDFPVFNLENVLSEYENWEEGSNFYPGQMYFYGITRPLYKFYPVPKYWTGSKWIYVDGNIQTFHKENLDNGFFQSVLLNVIGAPDKLSNHPDSMKEITGDDGVKRKVPTKTNAEVFDMMMSKSFSGVKKAGTGLVLWSENETKKVTVSPFPVNSNFDILSGTFTDAIRGITIATGVQAILANLPQQTNSLGSDGNAMQKAVELMQARVNGKQKILENFYNNVLLPNLQKGPKKKSVKITNYKPISGDIIKVDPSWFTTTVLTNLEMRAWVKNNIPGMETVIDNPDFKQPLAAPGTPVPGDMPVSPTAPIPTDPNTPAPTQGNEKLKDIGMADLNKISKIRARFQIGLSDPTNPKGVTFEQAKQLLASYGFTDEELKAWISQPNIDEI